VYKSIFINDISADRLDYMVKVERKSRKASDEAVMYIIIMKGDQNALPLMDSYTVSSAKSFLNNLIPDIEAANLELQIKAQEDIVAKAEKKLRDLKDDQTALERKLTQNKTDQDNTQKDIENQKQALGVLTGKRKTN
jgi:septal ring factor EnvC (AmiA/AmiB activator)